MNRKSPSLRALALLLSVLLAASLVACSNEEPEWAYPLVFSATVTNYVHLEVQYTNSKGDVTVGAIIIELFPSAAPLTVRHFQSLVGEGFYDGLTFHRIEKGYLIQGGSPNGTGDGGAATTVVGEFSRNGIENPLSHTRGTVSMARSDLSYDSASSQFFILQKDAEKLDGSYAAFGRVIHGMSTVDAIAKTKVRNGTPYAPVTIVHARFVTIGTQPDSTTPHATTLSSTAATALDSGVPTQTSAEQTTTPPSITAYQAPSTLPKTTSLPTVDPPQESPKLDRSPIDPSDYATTDAVTDLVLLSISHTAANGTEQTASIVLRLDPISAPQTVAQFQADVQSGAYNGVSFFYVKQNVMLQANAPTQACAEEATSTDPETRLTHQRGVASLLPSTANEAVSSSLILLCQDLPMLDGEGTPFAIVVYGMDAVDSITTVETRIDAETGSKTAPRHPIVITSAAFLTRKEN